MILTHVLQLWWADNQKLIWSRFQGLRTWFWVFEINWAWATFYAFFLAYGYYGAIAPGLFHYKHQLISSFMQLLLLVGIQATLGWVACKYPHSFKDSVKITLRDLIVYFSLALLLLILTFDRLNFSLFSDELSYAGSAHGQAIFLAMAAVRHIDWLDNYVFTYLVQAISILLFASLSYLLYKSAKWTAQKRIIVFAFLLVLGRFVFAIKGGNGSPHPSIQLIPLFVFGSVFGINDVSFKLSYFMVYVGFLTILCRMLFRIYPLTIAYVATLAIGTIPLFINTSTVVEHSLWSFICFALVVTEILTSTRRCYFRLVGFISIMTMMRQPSFISLFPVALLYFIESNKEGSFKQKLEEGAKLLPLLLLFLPFLATSLIKGTPSTNAWDQGSNLARVFHAIENGIILDSISSAFPYWWIVFMPLSIVPIQRKSLNINIALIVLFLVAIYVYYSIHPGLWGFAKYQMEYAGPLVIAGFFMIIRIAIANRVDNKLLMTFLFSMLFLNVLQIIEQRYEINMQKIFSKKETLNSEGEFALLKLGMTAIPYEYKKAYAYIKQKGFSNSTYSLGATYGVLPEIMNGYTTESVRASHDIYSEQITNRQEEERSEIIVQNIEGNVRIKAVMLGSIGKKQELITLLNKKGWQIVASYENSQYGTTVDIMTRP